MRGHSDRSMFVLAIAAMLGCHSGNPTPCAVNDDCWNSSEADEVGRCFPKDVWCERSRCRARCAELCKVIQPDVNPCRDPAMICTEAKNPGVQAPICTDRPIACSSPDDCPVFHPASGTDGEWECVDSVCRYPGFEYPRE